jgi:hypothetical protein
MAAKGNQLPQAIVTPELVIQIRKTTFAKSAKRWAKEPGMHHRSIEKIRSYGSWKHVNDQPANQNGART